MKKMMLSLMAAVFLVGAAVAQAQEPVVRAVAVMPPAGQERELKANCGPLLRIELLPSFRRQQLRQLVTGE